MTTHPTAQANMEIWQQKRSFHSAILKAVSDFNRNPQIEYYCSYYQLVAGYKVSTVLKITFPLDAIPYSVAKVYAEERYGLGKVPL